MNCTAWRAADVLTNPRSPVILLPFLYKTATIQRRNFSRRPRHQLEGPANSEQAETKSYFRKTTDDGPRQSLVHRQSINSRPDRSLPFERSQTQQRPAYRRPTDYRTREARPESEHDSYFRSDPQEAPDPRPKKNTTLTDVEKNAFDRLFRSLATQAQQQDEDAERRDAEGTDAIRLVEEVEDIGERGTGDLDVDRIINRELQLAAPNIEQYPADLRQMALDTQTKLAQSQAARERRARLEQQDPVTAKAQTVMKGIASRLKAASTDQELWQILDSAVFAHVRVLDNQGSKVEPERPRQLDDYGRIPEDEAIKAAQRRARTKKDTMRNRRFPGEEPTRTESVATVGGAADGSASTTPSPEKVAPVLRTDATTTTTRKEQQSQMDLAILRRVYPAALLLATRILSRSNQTPYIASLLPTIRSLHPVSLILGASTALYNEILRYTWHTSGSLASVLALLKDMSKLELTMDGRTWEILEQITLYQYRALRGDFGQGLKAMEGMEKRFREGREVWRNKAMIKLGLEQMELERSRRIEAEQLELRSGEEGRS